MQRLHDLGLTWHHLLGRSMGVMISQEVACLNRP